MGSGGEFRFAFRALGRAPVFSLTVVVLLAIGIGANVLVFSVIDSVLLEPIPFPDPDQLVQVWETEERTDRGPLSLHNVVELQEQSVSLTGVAAYAYQTLTIVGDEGAARVSGLATTTNFFEVLGAELVRGRSFRSDESVPGGAPVIVISTGFWRRHYSGLDDVLGQSVALGGRTFEVIGVAENRGAFGTIDVWMPLAMNLDEVKRGNHYLFGFARLRPDTSIEAAAGEIEAIGRRLAEQYGSANENRSFRLVPLRQEWYGQIATPLYVLLTTVAIVLLIVCANVAGLTLARTSGRRREVAIRAALGAGRRHLVRQFVAEGLFLAAIAGVSGTIMATWGITLVSDVIPGTVGRSIELDRSAVAVAVLATLLAALVSSLAPLVHMLRADVMSTLRVGGVQSAGNLRVGGRRAFVVVQYALAVVLLVAATLLARSLHDLWQFDPGFDPAGTLTMRVALGERQFDDPHEVIRVQRRILDEIGSISSVDAVGLVSDLPFSGSRSSSSFRVVGMDEYLTADRRQASDGYFEAMGMRILEGRGLRAEDDLSRDRVVVINQKMATTLWPGESAIGRRVVIGMPEEIDLEGGAMEREVVGVVASIVHDTLGAEPVMEIYLSSAQLPSRRLFVAVRSSEGMQSLMPRIREAVGRADASVAVHGVRTMSDRLSGSLRRNSIVTWVVGTFSVLALLLSIVGLYGLISYMVAQRTREFGVRRALGASAGAIVRRVVQEGAVLASFGTVVGIGASIFLMRFLRGLLYGVRPDDPLTLVTVGLTLAGVTVLACAIPAVRAANVEVMSALRDE